VPEEPLEPETGYVATVTLKTTDGRELTERWGFTTGLGQRPFLTIPRLGHPANPPLDWGRLGPAGGVGSSPPRPEADAR